NAQRAVMRWTDVDGAREYLNPRLFAATGGKQPTRKTIYNMIAAGMRVARRGDAEPSIDSKGRVRQGRIAISLEWVDEFLIATSEAVRTTEQTSLIEMPSRKRA